jgi:toxin FitB
VYLVDTNVIPARAPSKSVPSEELAKWMDIMSPRLFISVVTTGEVIAGIAKALREGATSKASSLEAWWATVEHLYGPRILPFDGAAARAAGRLLDKARGIGQSPGWADVAIAGTAKAHGLTVLTRNLRHFEPLGVTCLDPFKQVPPPP